MMPAPADASGCDLAARYAAVRARTLALAEGLSDADATVQSMDDASPAKWHLAHTTWFFEEFVLAGAAPAYRGYDARYRYLFNSYYDSVGARHPRHRRGLLTRPSLAEVLEYRAHVDDAMARLLGTPLAEGLAARLVLGLHHEQQHQELLLTDLLHLFAQNPLRPAYRPRAEAAARASTAPSPPAWIAYPGGRYEVGHDSATAPGFAFDCEGPRHAVLLRPFRLAARPVSNAEWCDFIADGGYRTPALWLSDGWKTVQGDGWTAPLYWENPADEPPRAMTLAGVQALDPAAPVAHVSFYEADAYARWAGKRLPSEYEWEVAARELPIAGNFADSGALHPLATPAAQGALGPQAEPAGAASAPAQMYGDVWEWSASPFVAYPGFRPAAGAIGEYNGKFMCNQFVLRGGSCATPAGHLRATYRNFFYPHQRWQFAGLRLAEDAA
ncbi:hypothetical protein OTERR_14680 [Oryzomicrobium terrae]|uniref:Ergothioneine biosynthesis protein EgtB n=2 Tax=Oryzomicrobium terrae TaxID=1735038 RepID=A0A5C1E8I1_9RHOO|nr:hypothetical protein OTERR_14680 [Oryzomicrobium terrae]